MRTFGVAVGVFLCLSSTLIAQAPRKPYDREHPYKSTHAPALKDVPNEQEIAFWTLDVHVLDNLRSAHAN
jgi:hypothetical protein